MGGRRSRGPNAGQAMDRLAFGAPWGGISMLRPPLGGTWRVEELWGSGADERAAGMEGGGGEGKEGRRSERAVPDPAAGYERAMCRTLLLLSVRCAVPDPAAGYERAMCRTLLLLSARCAVPDPAAGYERAMCRTLLLLRAHCAVPDSTDGCERAVPDPVAAGCERTVLCQTLLLLAVSALCCARPCCCWL
ncbi:hypothetical protein NDU88_010426 [Pleurodeles waltl]|uniref:Uncharacterized protein n=1 Tax=Pleurodeles waltl TaxID=8319 RepID=A0AAV7QYR3_PLEWA|nr:hypothetical protein NDU88_010426 [Pleurodeles waltl]